MIYLVKSIMESIRITLESLYDILRNEKKKEELQELEETFFIDVVMYLKEKKALLDTKQEDSNIFAAGEKEKVQYELRSIKRILKEIYEKREKKIIHIAINKSKTGSDIIDAGSMLREEKEFYNSILGTLDKYRKGVLFQLFNGSLPQITVSKQEIEKPSFEPKEESTPLKKPDSSKESESESQTTKVRFTHPMPGFVWKDMKTYGPYDVGEEIEIFPEVADLLVRKGRAEKI